MSHTKWISVWVILLAACLSGPIAQAQSDQSVADAARRAREQKKAAAKPITVITNDTLEPQGSNASGVQAQAPGSETNSTATTPAGGDKPASDSNAPAADQPTQEERAAQQAEIDALKREILEKQKELDLAQRALNLANDDFYSKPDFSKDAGGKAKLDAMKGEVDQVKNALDQLKAKLPPGVTLEPEKPQAPAGGDQAQPPQPQP